MFELAALFVILFFMAAIAMKIAFAFVGGVIGVILAAFVAGLFIFITLGVISSL